MIIAQNVFLLLLLIICIKNDYHSLWEKVILLGPVSEVSEKCELKKNYVVYTHEIKIPVITMV